MSWIASASGRLLTGNDAGGKDGEGVFSAFFEAFREIATSQGGTHERVLEALKAGAADDFVPSKYTPVVSHVAKTLLDLGVGRMVGNMRTPVGAVVAQADETRVDIFWPHGEWALDLGEDVSRLPVGMALSASGGVRFTLASDDGRTAPAGSVLARLLIDGEVGFNAKLTVPVAGISTLNAKGSFDAARSLSYLLAYDNDLRTWRAVGDSFARLRRVDLFNETLLSFTSPVPVADADPDTAAGSALNQIVIEGGENLLLRAGATLRIPLANYGTLRGRVGGQLKLGEGFTLRVEPGARERVLVVSAETRKSFDEDGEVGVGYALGVADLDSNAAKTLLNAVVGAKEVLEKIDDVIDHGETFLKPGALLKSKLTEELRSRIDSDRKTDRALRIALGDVVGLDADGDRNLIAERTGEFIGSLIDNSSNLFGDDLGASIKTVIVPIKSRVQSAVEKQLDDVAANAGKELGALLKNAAESLDNETHGILAELLGRKPEDVLKDLREFLNTARDVLTKIADGVRDSNLDLVTAEIAAYLSNGRESITAFKAEIEESGAEFYKSVIWRPSTGASRLIDHAVDLDRPPLPGVNPLLSEDSDAFRQLRGLSWNVGLIDTPITEAMLGVEGKRKTFAEAKVARTISGVSVGSEAWIKLRRETDFLFFDGAARGLELADSLSFVNAGSDEEHNKIETARLSLAYTWGEPNFGRREIKRFVESFQECGLLGEEGGDALISLREQAKRPGDSKPEASLRALLAIPADYAVDVIRFASQNLELARGVIGEVVSHAPFNEENFSRKQIHALISYFVTLDHAQQSMSELQKDASERERNQLREKLSRMSLNAQKLLRKEDWLEIRGLFGLGIALGKPSMRLRALFACLIALADATPGAPRPGMVYGFTAKDEITRFVISPTTS